MNWIEIDNILRKMIDRHTDAESMFAEAEKQFKWNRSQAEAAIKPLLKRNGYEFKIEKTVKAAKTRSKKTAKKKK